MQLRWLIALRYLFSPYKTRSIQWITLVSMVGMAVGTAALVLVLSVFNGFEHLAVSLFDRFYPDIKITPAQGKVFIPSDSLLLQLRQQPEIDFVSEVIEENVLLRHQDYEYIATLKGVDADFEEVNEIRSSMFRGTFQLFQKSEERIILGAGIASRLQLNVLDDWSSVQVFVPRRTQSSGLVPGTAFQRRFIRPSGSFSVQQEFDFTYGILPIETFREWLQFDAEVSALEIRLKPGFSDETTAKRLQQWLGSDFIVQHRIAQNALYFQVMTAEKWVVYAILSLILVIAAFNILGSLSMVIMDKRRDISILKALGADAPWIERLFLLEGLCISGLGSMAGLGIALLLCWLQITFEWIPLQGSGSFIVSAYPVKVKGTDLLLIGSTVIIISLLTSWLPAKRASVVQDLTRQAG